MRDDRKGAPRRSMAHDQWTKTMKAMASAHPNPNAREVAAFCAEVLERSADTPELDDFLNQRALAAFGDAA